MSYGACRYTTITNLTLKPTYVHYICIYTHTHAHSVQYTHVHTQANMCIPKRTVIYKMLLYVHETLSIVMKTAIHHFPWLLWPAYMLKQTVSPGNNHIIIHDHTCTYYTCFCIHIQVYNLYTSIITCIHLHILY